MFELDHFNNSNKIGSPFEETQFFMLKLIENCYQS